MPFTRFSIIVLSALQFLFSSLTIHALKIPSCLDKGVLSVHSLQTGPFSDRYADLSTSRPDVDPHSKGKFARRTGEPPRSASELLSLLHPKAPECLDTIEQTCPTVFAGIQDTATNNASAASLYRTITSSTCLDTCSRDIESMKWIQWLTKFSQSAVVKADMNETSLQDDWIDWPSVSRRARAAMIPWKWTLVANLSAPNDRGINLQCPKRSDILSSFAVINGCLAILGVVFAHRGFINRLTCGSLGRPPIEETPGGMCEWVGSWLSPRPGEKALADTSRTLGFSWLFGGGLIVLLNIIANIINAVIVRSSAGFADTPLLDLAILWMTRPRVGWFVLLWTNVKPTKNTYVSAAWSAMLAEYMMQMIGLKYLIPTVRYGVKSGFFSIGAFQDIPDGRWGLAMYASAIVWIAIIGLMLPCALIVIYHGAVTAREVQFGLKAHKKHSHSHMYLLWALFAVAFISQWVFWAGYVHIAGDTYCPPQVWVYVGVWLGFGLVTTVTGGAF